MVRDKVAAAVRNEITPILCIGETKQERDDGETKQVLHDQLMSALSNLTGSEIQDMVIAYEPVWAIGHDNITKPDQAESAVKYIRSYIHDVFGERAAKGLRILYGGGVVPEAIHGFLKIKDINGFLVGHESINYHDFAAIIESARRWQRQGEED